MIIKAVDAMHYRLPLSSTMRDSTHGDMTHFEVIMVRLETNEGVQGLGYTYTIGQGGTAVRSLIDQAIKPMLLNANAWQIEKIWGQMWWGLHYIGRGGLVSFAMSAVDIALWDLHGCQKQVPLWQLLGGHSPQITPYAGGIDLHLSLDDLLRQTQNNLDKGFLAIKMKVGQKRVRQDIERVKAMRELIGPDIRLMVDANMRWDVETAVRAARQMTAYDVSNIGGITNWMRVAKLAYAHNLPVTTHGVHELHLHLLAAIPNPSYLEVHSFGLERFILNPPEIVDGVMTAPNLSGHGVQFDWQVLQEFQMDK